MLVRIITCVALTSLCVPSGLFAQEAKTGRMPDGRAFRTDSQGMVMVDYIAELELETDSLRRQVQGLEGELEDFRNGAGTSTRTIVREVECPPQPIAQPISCPEKECPIATCPEKICPAPKVCPVANEVSGSCDEEALVIAQLEKDIQQMNEREQSLADKFNVASMQLNAAKQREASISIENQNLRKDLTARAAMNIQKLAPPALPQKPASGNLAESRKVFLTQVQADLTSQVETLQKLVAKRDARYQSFKSNYSGVVSLVPQAIEFSSGEKLGQAKENIQNESSMRKLSEYGRQIKTLTEKINFEIGMMDRLQSKKTLGQ